MSTDTSFCRLYADNAIDEVKEDSCFNYEKQQKGRQIRSQLKPNFCLTALDSGNLIMSSCTNSQNQLFKYTKDGGLTTMNGRCVSVLDNNYENASPIVAWNTNACDKTNYTWIQDSQTRLRSDVNPEFCMDIYGANKEDGANVVLYQCNEGINQQWIVQ